MKEERKDMLFFIFMFTASMTGIMAMFGIAIFGIEGEYWKMPLTIPFWIICGISYIGAYLTAKFVKVPEVKE